jgi:hypothetical protein
LLLQLKIFDVVGWSFSAIDVSHAVVEYVARRMAVESKTTQISLVRTRRRHRNAILRR